MVFIKGLLSSSQMPYQLKYPVFLTLLLHFLSCFLVPHLASATSQNLFPNPFQGLLPYIHTKSSSASVENKKQREFCYVKQMTGYILLGIRGATCSIHFSFPSPRIFGQRLYSMTNNFWNMIIYRSGTYKGRISHSYVSQEYMGSIILLTEH